ncbi:MAG: hypothetical protein JNK25_01495 [Phycisphaerae bacterium]|nr:hypothetical protein [Phycisphaerae bacterium]
MAVQAGNNLDDSTEQELTRFYLQRAIEFRNKLMSVRKQAPAVVYTAEAVETLLVDISVSASPLHKTGKVRDLDDNLFGVVKEIRAHVIAEDLFAGRAMEADSFLVSVGTIAMEDWSDRVELNPQAFLHDAANIGRIVRALQQPSAYTAWQFNRLRTAPVPPPNDPKYFVCLAIQRYVELSVSQRNLPDRPNWRLEPYEPLREDQQAAEISRQAQFDAWVSWPAEFLKWVVPANERLASELARAPSSAEERAQSGGAIDSGIAAPIPASNTGPADAYQVLADAIRALEPRATQVISMHLVGATAVEMAPTSLEVRYAIPAETGDYEVRTASLAFANRSGDKEVPAAARDEISRRWSTHRAQVVSVLADLPAETRRSLGIALSSNQELSERTLQRLREVAASPIVPAAEPYRPAVRLKIPPQPPAPNGAAKPDVDDGVLMARLSAAIEKHAPWWLGRLLYVRPTPAGIAVALESPLFMDAVVVILSSESLGTLPNDAGYGSSAVRLIVGHLPREFPLEDGVLDFPWGRITGDPPGQPVRIRVAPDDASLSVDGSLELHGFDGPFGRASVKLRGDVAQPRIEIDLKAGADKDMALLRHRLLVALGEPGRGEVTALQIVGVPPRFCLLRDGESIWIDPIGETLRSGVGEAKDIARELRRVLGAEVPDLPVEQLGARLSQALLDGCLSARQWQWAVPGLSAPAAFSVERAELLYDPKLARDLHAQARTLLTTESDSDSRRNQGAPSASVSYPVKALRLWCKATTSARGSGGVELLIPLDLSGNALSPDVQVGSLEDWRIRLRDRESTVGQLTREGIDGLVRLAESSTPHQRVEDLADRLGRLGLKARLLTASDPLTVLRSVVDPSRDDALFEWELTFDDERGEIPVTIATTFSLRPDLTIKRGEFSATLHPEHAIALPGVSRWVEVDGYGRLILSGAKEATDELGARCGEWLRGLLPEELNGKMEVVLREASFTRLPDASLALTIRAQAAVEIDGVRTVLSVDPLVARLVPPEFDSGNPSKLRSPARLELETVETRIDGVYLLKVDAARQVVRELLNSRLRDKFRGLALSDFARENPSKLAGEIRDAYLDDRGHVIALLEIVDPSLGGELQTLEAQLQGQFLESTEPLRKTLTEQAKRVQQAVDDLGKSVVKGSETLCADLEQFLNVKLTPIGIVATVSCKVQADRVTGSLTLSRTVPAPASVKIGFQADARLVGTDLVKGLHFELPDSAAEQQQLIAVLFGFPKLPEWLKTKDVRLQGTRLSGRLRLNVAPHAVLRADSEAYAETNFDIDLFSVDTAKGDLTFVFPPMGYKGQLRTGTDNSKVAVEVIARSKLSLGISPTGTPREYGRVDLRISLDGNDLDGTLRFTEASPKLDIKLSDAMKNMIAGQVLKQLRSLIPKVDFPGAEIANALELKHAVIDGVTVPTGLRLGRNGEGAKVTVPGLPPLINGTVHVDIRGIEWNFGKSPSFANLEVRFRGKGDVTLLGLAKIENLSGAYADGALYFGRLPEQSAAGAGSSQTRLSLVENLVDLDKIEFVIPVKAAPRFTIKGKLSVSGAEIGDLGVDVDVDRKRFGFAISLQLIDGVGVSGGATVDLRDKMFEVKGDGDLLGAPLGSGWLKVDWDDHVYGAGGGVDVLTTWKAGAIFDAGGGNLTVMGEFPWWIVQIGILANLDVIEVSAGKWGLNLTLVFPSFRTVDGEAVENLFNNLFNPARWIKGLLSIRSIPPKINLFGSPGGGSGGGGKKALESRLKRAKGGGGDWVVDVTADNLLIVRKKGVDSRMVLGTWPPDYPDGASQTVKDDVDAELRNVEVSRIASAVVIPDSKELKDVVGVILVSDVAPDRPWTVSPGTQDSTKRPEKAVIANPPSPPKTTELIKMTVVDSHYPRPRRSGSPATSNYRDDFQHIENGKVIRGDRIRRPPPDGSVVRGNVNHLWVSLSAVTDTLHKTDWPSENPQYIETHIHAVSNPGVEGVLTVGGVFVTAVMSGSDWWQSPVVYARCEPPSEQDDREAKVEPEKVLLPLIHDTGWITGPFREDDPWNLQDPGGAPYQRVYRIWLSNSRLSVPIQPASGGKPDPIHFWPAFVDLNGRAPPWYDQAVTAKLPAIEPLDDAIRIIAAQLVVRRNNGSTRSVLVVCRKDGTRHDYVLLVPHKAANEGDLYRPYTPASDDGVTSSGWSIADLGDAERILRRLLNTEAHEP